jgi:hypothetical protein
MRKFLIVVGGALAALYVLAWMHPVSKPYYTFHTPTGTSQAAGPKEYLRVEYARFFNSLDSVLELWEQENRDYTLQPCRRIFRSATRAGWECDAHHKKPDFFGASGARKS